MLQLFVICLLFAPCTYCAVSDSDVTFYLYTQNHSDNAIQISKTYLPLDQDSNLVFLIHGYHESRQAVWYENLKNVLLSKGLNLSVIEVDWSKPANNIWYPTSAIDTKAVGQLIADLITTMVKNRNVSTKKIHLCGHSLGAQVAGFAGKALIANGNSTKAYRITGLDPAGPGFVGVGPNNRLTKDDADVVVIVHTNRYVAGYPFSLNAVDFFPNNGLGIQPGCPINVGTGNQWFACSHQRSHDFFIDALRHPNTYIGTKCESWIAYRAGTCDGNKQLDMGSLNITAQDIADYYLRTNAQPPWGQGTTGTRSLKGKKHCGQRKLA